MRFDKGGIQCLNQQCDIPGIKPGTQLKNRLITDDLSRMIPQCQQLLFPEFNSPVFQLRHKTGQQKNISGIRFRDCGDIVKPGYDLPVGSFSLLQQIEPVSRGLQKEESTDQGNHRQYKKQNDKDPDENR